jgi:hypothetical protein
MLEIDICQESEQGDDWHSRWLAMQSAYAEYRRCSEVLECTRKSPGDFPSSDSLQLTLMEGRQRLAFERYMDARLAFLESRFDEMNRTDIIDGAQGRNPAAIVENPRGAFAWVSAAGSRPVLQTLAVMLLCVMTFSLMWEQNRVRNLEAGRDELQAALGRTVREVQLLRGRLDAAETSAVPPRSIVRPPAPPMKPFATQKQVPAGKAPSEGKKPQRPPRQVATANPTPANETTRRESGLQNTSGFSIASAHKVRRVGPLTVLLRSVDLSNKTASVSITSDTTEVDVQRLKIDQPVWITTSRNRRVGLVADRIAKDRLDGHLLDPEAGPAGRKNRQHALSD